ncbi:DNA methylase [Mycobacterium phage GaugeLDP]|nr:DNA methylase [Mycobacterium phage GaugeLDP]
MTDAASAARHTTTTGVMNSGTTLTDAVRGLLPTPSARDFKGPNPNARQGGDDLPTAALKMLPTPGSQDGERGVRSEEALARKAVNGQRLDRQRSLSDIPRLLPTPEAKSSTAGPDFARANRPGSGGDDLVTTVAKATLGELDWGDYKPAIERWEALTRPAPYPIEPNTKGKPRLAARFSEWMMGWAEGWVTDLVDPEPRRRPAEGYISRTEALRMVGNGVCTQQAAQALRDLLAA